MDTKTKPKRTEEPKVPIEPELTSKELEVLILILTELRAINHQLRTEVVIRDRYR